MSSGAGYAFSGAAGGALNLGDTGEVSAALSSTAALPAAGTFASAFIDVSGYSGVSIACSVEPVNATGNVYADFSTDGVTVDSTITWPIASGTTGVPPMLSVTRQYLRVRVVNDGVPQTALRLQTILNHVGRLSVPTSRIDQAVTDYSDVLNTRAILTGQYPSGAYGNVTISTGEALRINVASPTTAFGEVLNASLSPRVQVDAVYGILTTDHETFTAGTGTVDGSNSLFTVATGAAVGAYAVIRSKRTARYLPGEGLRARITSMHSVPGVANSLALAGVFTATDGYFVGYVNGVFGMLRRIAGAIEIQQLTVTVGTAGAPETVTVTLNGVAYAVVVGAGLTTSQVAEAIAERVGGYGGWTSGVSPQSVGSTVIFSFSSPQVMGGAYSMTSTGTAAGNFTPLQIGAPNDDTTGFVPQTSWNGDQLDGTGGVMNPTGVLLNPSKLNVWEFVIPYLGAGATRLRYQTPRGFMETVHTIQYPNNYTIPNQKNPNFRLGWIAASLGSVTDIDTAGASGMLAVEGPLESLRDPFAATNRLTVDTNERVIIALQCRGEFAGTTNQRVAHVMTATAAIETANRLVRFKVYINSATSGTMSWQYVSQPESSTLYSAPATATVSVSGGRFVAGGSSPSGAPITLNLSPSDIRLEAGDTLVITAQAASSTAVSGITVSWQEV